MSDGVGIFGARDLDHSFRNERARNTRAKQILTFIDRACLEHREDEITREFSAQILDDAFRCATR